MDHGRMRRFVSLDALFVGRHFDKQIIILCVSWYTSFKLSFRDLVIMMADRGIPLAHTTILRWVQHYLPEFEKRWNRYARPVGGSWRMDETYIKVRGHWVYLYRAVDKAGRTVDFFLSRKRDVNAAKSFLRRAMKNTRTPTKITLDAYAASHRAVREMKEDGELPRSSEGSIQPIFDDHRLKAGGIRLRLKAASRCVGRRRAARRLGNTRRRPFALCAVSGGRFQRIRIVSAPKQSETRCKLFA